MCILWSVGGMFFRCQIKLVNSVDEIFILTDVLGCSSFIIEKVILKSPNIGAPGWLTWLSVRLWFRSWSHGSCVQAPLWALCWKLRAWNLFHILCFPLSLPLPHLHSVSLSLKNKPTLKIFFWSPNIFFLFSVLSFFASCILVHFC